MSENMGELDSVKVIKKKLMESLGDKYEEYLKLIRNWFRMKADREQLEAELKMFLTPHQKHLHDQLLLHLLQKCVDKPTIVSDSCGSGRRYRNFEKFKDGFESNFMRILERICTKPQILDKLKKIIGQEVNRHLLTNVDPKFWERLEQWPIDPIFYAVTERQEVNSEMPPFMIHERLLPDHSSTLARIMYSAWELGLDGSHPNTAEFLMVATQHFLKNILTAVITRKKGYKCSQNGFIHSLGCPTPNPWLHNVAKRKPEQFHSLKFDNILNNGIVKPAERPTREELEHEAMFQLSASTCDQETTPISLYDLILTLQLYPSLVASNFVRVVNIERIYARICHPAIDD